MGAQNTITMNKELFIIKGFKTCLLLIGSVYENSVTKEGTENMNLLYSITFIYVICCTNMFN